MEITKKQIVLLLKNGLSIWIDKDVASLIEQTLQNSKQNFFSIPELNLGMQSIYNIEGFYTPQQYAEIQHFKNGGWKCEFGKLHDRRQKCNCESEAQKQKRIEYENAYYQEKGYYPL